MDAARTTGNLEDRSTGPAPRFGRAMLAHWALDPAITYLNHGTVGAPPRRVLEAQAKIRDQIERQPSRFLLRELTAITVGVPESSAKPLMRAAAEQVAAFLGARGDDLAFVDNATTGVNAVLRSLAVAPGDEIVIHDHAYGAVANAAGFVARERGASLVTVEIPYPPGPGQVAAAFAAAIGPRTRLVIVDHITSNSALLMPLAEVAAACRERGVAVLADGAHAPGAIALDLPSLGVDWYVGNLHKWAHSPRSCGILWAPPERQAGLHPTVISWGLDRGFTAEFDLVGTRDPSPFLAAPEGLAFLRDLGFEAVRDYDHDLAWRGAHELARRWGTAFAPAEATVGTMATVPLPERAGATEEQAVKLRDALLFEDAIEVQLHAWRGRLWARISGQVYNDMDDVTRLAEAVAARL